MSCQIETPSHRAMEKLVLVFLLYFLVCLGTAQQHLRARGGPWRHRIQWENNGQMYSLLSTGTQYRSPAQARRRTQLLLTTKNSFNRVNLPLAPSRPTRARAGLPGDAVWVHPLQNDLGPVDAAVLGADAGQYFVAPGRPGSPGRTPLRMTSAGEAVALGYPPQQSPSNSTAAAIQEFSGSGVPRGGRSTTGAEAGAQQVPASPMRSADFTHSQGGRMKPESSDSGVRSPATSGSVSMAEDSGNAGRILQQTSVGDAHRARSQTRLTPESNVVPTAPSGNSVEIHFGHGPDPARTTETSDPRDPHSIHHRNSVFYNVYPPDRRNRITARPPPGTGYGTRFFHNGEAERWDTDTTVCTSCWPNTEFDHHLHHIKNTQEDN